MGSGSRVQVLGFIVWDWGFRVSKKATKLRVLYRWDCRASGFGVRGFRFSDLWIQVRLRVDLVHWCSRKWGYGFGFRILGFGVGISGLGFGFRLLGLGLPV